MSVIPTGHEIFKDGFNVSVNVETEELDKAIAKTKEFIELLREAEELADKLCNKMKNIDMEVSTPIPDSVLKNLAAGERVYKECKNISKARKA